MGAVKVIVCGEIQDGDRVEELSVSDATKERRELVEQDSREEGTTTDYNTHNHQIIITLLLSATLNT